MKKLTILFSVMMAFAFCGSVQAKEIKIYVKAAKSPYIYYWNGGLTSPSDMPGERLPEETISCTPITGGEAETFYSKTFSNLADDASISFLFSFNDYNDKGYGDKTCDINGIDGHRYYYYKGNYEYEDITSRFVEGYTDKVITEVKLPGDFNEWKGDGFIFTRDGESNVWTLDADFSSQGDTVVFKLQPKEEGVDPHWLGWGDCFINAPSGLVENSNDNKNIKLNLSGSKKYRFTATWGGGNIGSGGWMLTIDPAVSVSVAGYTAYTTYYGVTFPDGMTAYKVTSAEKKAYLDEVTEAPKNTPLILKANEGDYFLTLKNNAASVGANYLKVSDGSVTGDGSTIYALGNKNGVGFYLVDDDPEADVHVPARKPYLEIDGDDVSVKSFLAFDFDNTASGLTAAKNEGVKSNRVIYNLAGQRVQKATRGLYIVNGKKVVIK